MSDNLNGPSSRMVPVWEVDRIEDTTAFTAGKGAVRVKRVWYRLFDGTESYEDFPAASFDPAKISDAIDKQAQKVYAALQLKGPEIELRSS